MKAILNSLQENTLSRLKNPIIGAFIFSWSIWNVSDVIIFILSDTESKLKIIQTSKMTVYDNLLAPLFICSLYLFALPLLSAGYEIILDGIINKFRNSYKQKHLQEYYASVKKTVIAKLDADEDENRKIREKELEKWGEEKTRMSKICLKFKQEYSEKISKIDELKSLHEKEIERLNNDIYDTTRQYETLQTNISKIIENMQSHVGSLDKRDDLPNDVQKEISTLRRTINTSWSSLNTNAFPNQRLNSLPPEFNDDIPF